MILRFIISIFKYRVCLAKVYRTFITIDCRRSVPFWKKNNSFTGFDEMNKLNLYYTHRFNMIRRLGTMCGNFRYMSGRRSHTNLSKYEPKWSTTGVGYNVRDNLMIL